MIGHLMHLDGWCRRWGIGNCSRFFDAEGFIYERA